MRSAVLLATAVAAYLVIKEASNAGLLTLDSEDQTGSFIDQLPDIEDIANMTQQNLSPDQVEQNRAAFLAALRYSEGTRSEEGYRALFGWRPGNGKTFDSFDGHPRQFFNYTNLAGNTVRTSAAGAYQITATTFDALNQSYPGQFMGFWPESQDAMALMLIKERGALADVDAGRFAVAVGKVRKVWASLPGSGVDQPTRSYDNVAAAYTQAGGIIV